MADDITPQRGRDWGWKPYVFLILILALLYLPFPNRHPQLDGIGYYMGAKLGDLHSMGALATTHMLPQPFFVLMNLLHKSLGIGYNLAGFFSLCDSLLMIGSILILYGFYRNIIRKSQPAFLSALALGTCFAAWYFGTDIENVSLAIFSTALLLNVGWRTSHQNTVTRGILLGFLALFATLCMQTLAVLSLFMVIFFLRQHKHKLAFSMLATFLLTLFLTYFLVAFAYLGLSNLDELKAYLFGHAEISRSQHLGWMRITPMTPFAAVVGFSRAILGLHPLMNIPWVKELALTSLRENVLSNQIAMAEGIVPWLKYPLIATTFILALTLPLLVWFAWKGSKRPPSQKDLGVDTRLLLIYACFMALLTTIWLPQGGEFWLPIVTVLIPLAMRYLTKLQPAVWIYIYGWIGILAFTNLFGSIQPFANDAVDPTLPSILYLDEIRHPDDLYLIPYNKAYPQRWVFNWVLPVASVGLDNTTANPLWENEFGNGKGIIYFSSDLYNLAPQTVSEKMGPAFYLKTADWERITRHPDKVTSLGALVILAAQR
jgi:hypothetical protein